MKKDTSFKDPYLIRVDNESWERMFAPTDPSRIKQAVERIKESVPNIVNI